MKPRRVRTPAYYVLTKAIRDIEIICSMERWLTTAQKKEAIRIARRLSRNPDFKGLTKITNKLL